MAKTEAVIAFFRATSLAKNAPLFAARHALPAHPVDGTFM
jgi:hypothetical protein